MVAALCHLLAFFLRLETLLHTTTQKILGARMEGICHPVNSHSTLSKNTTHLFNLPYPAKTKKTSKSHVFGC